MEEDYFWTLVSRYFSKEASEEEKAALAELLAESEARQQQWEYAKQQWKAHPKLPKHDRTRAKQLLVRGVAKARQREEILGYEKTVGRKRRVGQWLRWGAACLFIGLSVLFYFRYEKTASESTPLLSIKKIEVPNGNIQKILLPDGTKVWLNAGSTLEYAEPFLTRNVLLTGEGFFDVVRDEASPFTVQTEDLKVRVLGTSFNVKEYKNEPATVAVASGSVRVSLEKDSSEHIVLSPAEGVIVDKAHATFIKSTPDLSRLAAWREGKLIFQDQSLREIIPTLERWYQVQIVLSDESIGDRRFSGTFQQEQLQNILQIMHHAICIDFTITQQQVTLEPGSCE
uniref:DUF4974 domain-containing protein n=1 Tax=Roseihalotalea indica TaxID=2867963 RepID=A0AA49GJ12_9BACT|nr:DUF4974 domain-containing protein [Tunicatimonas sp. TK19036]